MVYFRETQPLTRNPILWIAVVITGAAAAYPLVRAEIRVDEGIPVAVLPLAILLWLFVVRLETEVRESGVHLRFRALWFPKTFSWDRIQDAEAVRYRPLLHYGGWGIRRGFKEWAWNVSGSEGVRLHFADGHSFLIGSAEPDHLAAAIRERLQSGTAAARDLY